MKLAINGGEPVRKTSFPDREPYGEDELRELREALATQNLFYQPANKVARFEQQFASMYGVKHALCSTSGTAAIHLAVAALMSDPGGEVITSPVTDFGTIAGILYQGLIPVFADWKIDTLNTDPADIERKITDRTRAILVVHIFGNPCDMDAIMSIGEKHGIPVVEDCCQAYCTAYNGKWVGSIGDIGCFSMQQSKHLTTGDGGVTITDNDEYARRIRLLHDKGWSNRGEWGPRSYEFLGLNYRMNELTGAVALAQLGKVENTVKTLRHLGDLLTGLIGDVPGIMPAPITSGGEHAYWVYPFKVTGHNPRQFIDALQAEGIPVEWGYTGKPIYLCTGALHAQETFGTSSYPFKSEYYGREVEYKEGLCPVAESELALLGHLRIWETWSEQDIRDVASAFRKVAACLEAQDAHAGIL